MRLGSEYTSSEMLEIIKQRGYFQIRLMPNRINKFTFQELEEIIRKNQVRHRGTYYPHLGDHNFGKFQRIANCIESFHQWGTAIDMWKFYKSGQFMHYRGFVEDRWDDHPPLGMQWTPDMESPTPSITFLEPIMKIWELTEIFLFASRFATAINCNLNIEINLHHMNDRKLEIHTHDRFGLSANYTCHTETIDLKSIEITPENLKIEHDELAVNKTLEIFDYFGWNANHLPSLLKDEQKKFYSHSF